MNIWTAVHFSAFLIYSVLVVYVILKNPNAVINWMLAAVFLCMWFWSGTNTILYNSYVSPLTADFVLRVQSLSWAVFPAFYALFLFHLMKKTEVLNNLFLYIALFFVTAFFQFGNFSGQMLICCDRTYFGLTGIWKNSFYVYLFIVYSAVVFAVLMLNLISFIRKHKQGNYRKSAEIILGSTVMFFVVTVIVSFVLKALRIHIPLQVNITLLVFVAGIVYAAEKYSFFEINAETAADKIVESIDEGLILTDMDGIVVEANKHAVEMMERFGNPRGKNIFELLGENSLVKRVASGEKIMEEEAVRETPSGRKVYTISAGPVEKRGERFGYICVINDITARKTAEEELKYTIAELKKSNADLEQFANVAAHDLKEPARMVASHVQLLKKKAYEKLDGAQKEHMDFAVEGAFRMNSLINDLLDYAAIQSGTVKNSMLNLDLIAAGAITALKQNADEAGAKITVSESLLKVCGDEKQVIRLFINVIGNAVKFRLPGVNPKIQISAREDAEYVLVKIKDNGIGINGEYLDKIFNIFQRLNPRERYEGNGVGLAVCRRIMERHGGKIWAESAGEGLGSTFVIEFKK